jgi:hypothetical protein
MDYGRNLEDRIVIIHVRFRKIIFKRDVCLPSFPSEGGEDERNIVSRFSFPFGEGRDGVI